MREYRLISSDSHVTMPDEAWQTYLDPQFRDRAPVIEKTPDGDVRVFEGKRTPVQALSNMAGRKAEDFALTVRSLQETRSGAWDPVERIKDMDIDGVDAEILYFGGPLASSDPALRLNSVRGYNRWLSDFSSHALDRLLGVASIPIDTPEIAAAEIRWAAKQPGLVSGVIPLFPDQGEYGDEKWNVMWEAFIETGFPVGLHSSGRRPGMPPLALSDGAARFMSGMITNKWALGESVSELIHGLVLERYADLKIVVVEGQIGWISFFKYYSDHLWEKHRYWTDSKLPMPPSNYFERQVYATFMEDPVGLRERHEIGIGNIMWASDYPHSETTWPNSKSLTDEWFTPYGDEDKAKILWQNCARLYNLI
ncbi:MAG: amidohydrolase family protein [Acidimicrobiia bacterium]